MRFEVRLPALADNMREATILRWFKGPGDPIKAGEPLVEFMTEKVNVEFESPAGGLVAEICCQPDAVVEVGGLLAVIETGGEAG